MESPQQVEDYLARFGVEQTVQEAVNSAIRHKAQDPISHVADFLEARGKQLEHLATTAMNGAGRDDPPRS